MVDGEVTDTITFLDSGSWQNNGTQNIDGVDYTHYTSGTATLFVDIDINVV